ncbi:DNA primase [Acinetobacter bereziniae]|uniref:contractile injection system protein, VgrG/Pvc8 family n=1 Tax=Acinetobacter bereziniae TaxID=106648 RepID=UPI0022EA7FA7|nr:contractile injection system protein, VgrG/Pvc8 family [Acinetobacter bereziniae]MDA3440031.1 DNA primase [Acinetobacter bereziniae]
MDIVSQVIGKYVSLTNYPNVIFRITVNDIDISSHIASRLISLSIQDNRGMNVDSIDISLDDSDNMLEIPSVGAEMKVWLGWNDTGLIYKGSYLVTGGSHSGAPDVLNIAAESTDLAESFRQKRERSFHQKTLIEIFQTIAFDYGLKTIVHADIADRMVNHLDQNDSDANIMTRLADENDAIATVKNGTLLLLPIGEAQTASGLDLPAVQLVRSYGDQHNYGYGQNSNKVEAVKAFYHDKDKGEKQYIIVGYSSDNPKEIRFVHRDKKTAELAAHAEFNRCKRSEQTLSYTLAKGRADLIPEQEFTFTGLKTQIDEIVWLGKTITHQLNESSGFTTQIELEVQLPNADDISILFDDTSKLEKDKNSTNEVGLRKIKNYKDYTGVKTWYAAKPKALVLTLGNQSNALILTRTYKTKKTAQVALQREWARIQKAKG